MRRAWKTERQGNQKDLEKRKTRNIEGHGKEKDMKLEKEGHGKEKYMNKRRTWKREDDERDMEKTRTWKRKKRGKQKNVEKRLRTWKSEGHGIGKA